MNKDFVFEVGTSVDDGAPQSQSPWDFSKYSQTVTEEHLKRKTTPLDFKISQARRRFEHSRRKAIGDGNGEENIVRLARKKRWKKGEVGDRDGGDIGGGGLHAKEEEDSDEEVIQGSGDGSFEEEFSEGDGVEVQMHNNQDSSQSEVEDDSEGEGNSDSEEEKLDTDDEASGKRDDKHGFSIEDVERGKKALNNFFASAEGASFNANTFVELNISRPLIRACQALGYTQPTPIQAACIPLALTGRDICGSAMTGSGKTAAFALPLLERLLFRPRRIPAIRVLILTPTRELAVQVHSMIEKLSQFTDARCCLVVGGLSTKVQEVALRSQPDIVVATPGRMIDHLHNSQSVGLEELSILVLDEADRLLQLGFIQEVHELVRLCPKRRQTMLFSATMTEEVDELIKLSLTNPVRLSADPSTKRPSTLSEEVIKIRPHHEADREAVLLALCARSFTKKTIIFSGTKVEAHRLKILFGLSGLKAAELHGNLTQAQRLDALELFRKEQVDFLIATDVAARGLDIVGVETVINFECPRDITTYVHRVGRTARAGQHGCAVTFVTENDRSLLKSVVKKAGSKLQSRVVPPMAINTWSQKIEEMEHNIHAILVEEKEERLLRKAEMEANKAQNLLEHESEIFARPKRVWFQTPKEKRQVAKAAKAVVSGKENVESKFVSVEEAQEMKKKEKRRTEQEKHMTRRKRRRLEACREAAEGESDEDGTHKKVAGHFPKKGDKKTAQNGSNSLVELAYRKAKIAKVALRARESGRMPQKRNDSKKKRPKSMREKNRREEMQELFQGDVNGTMKRRNPGVSRKAFKSKARYKRR